LEGATLQNLRAERLPKTTIYLKKPKKTPMGSKIVKPRRKKNMMTMRSLLPGAAGELTMI
jgi:hypothetical protein